MTRFVIALRAELECDENTARQLAPALARSLMRADPHVKLVAHDAPVEERVGHGRVEIRREERPR